MNQLSGRTRPSPPPAVSISELSDQFANVVSDPSRPACLDIPSGPVTSTGMRSFKPAYPSEVRRILRKLDDRKATGSDGIPAAVLRRCAPILAPSLSILINASLSSGTVPSALKLADVRPLFKAGDPNLATNYRPILCLPQC